MTWVLGEVWERGNKCLDGQGTHHPLQPPHPHRSSSDCKMGPPGPHSRGAVDLQDLRRNFADPLVRFMVNEVVEGSEDASDEEFR